MPNWDRCRRTFAWVNRLPPWFVTAVATLGPIGRFGPAPGTLGSAVGIVFLYLIYPGLPMPAVWVLLALGVYLAVAFCDAGETHLGARDPGCIILDEFVAMPFCFLGVFPAIPESGWPWWLAPIVAFALFRFFDIAKPLGIRRLQKLPGGLGVVVDDLAAALATCAVLNLAVRWHHFFGA